MDKLLQPLYDAITNNWRHPFAALYIFLFQSIVFLLLLVLVNSALPFKPFIDANMPLVFLVFVILSTFTTTIWAYFRGAPKARKLHVGFAVAVATDHEDLRSKLAQDFTATIKTLLAEAQHPHKFSVVQVPDYYSRLITRENAFQYLFKMRCRFMVFGAAKSRNIDGTPTHVLDLSCTVAHAQLPPDQTKPFQQAISEFWSPRLNIPVSNDLQGLEFTSHYTATFAEYVIGLAALASLDPNYAASLFEGIKSRKPSQMIKASPIFKLYQKLPERLLQSYQCQVSQAHILWRRTHEIQHLERADSIADKILALAPNHYTACISKSVYIFTRFRDIKAAKSFIARANKPKDATWQFNLAFLDAYQGHLHEAHKVYKQAIKGEWVIPLATELENYITWILEQEPDKYQLYYCLGLINYYLKQDYAQSKQDFETFLNANSNSRFVQEGEHAQRYLLDLNNRLNSEPEPK